MIKLSIIVPVYNVQEYIDECIESIVEQIPNNSEIILVDDGSTDNSGKKCDAWAKKTNCIVVIHKPNGGLSSARNAGLNHSSGDYVIFVDSDDKIARGSLTAIQKCISESLVDYYFLYAKKFYPSGKEEYLDEMIDRQSIRNKSSVDVLKCLAKLTRFPGSACTKAYSRDFLNTHKLRFPNDRRIAEDLGFTLRCILAADSFDVCEHDFYYYRQDREGSITSNSTSINKSFWNLMIFINESVDLISNNKIPKGEKEKFALSLVAYEYSVALIHYCKVTERTEAARVSMSNKKWLKKYLKSKRGRIISFMLSVLGIRMTSVILSFLYLRKKT